MFTGLVEATVPLVSYTPVGTGARLVLGVPPPDWLVQRGASISVLGACLSVVDRGPAGELVFDLSSETLARTRLGRLPVGALVNLERAMQLGDRLDGHMVSGHVDGLGRIVEFYRYVTQQCEQIRSHCLNPLDLCVGI